MTNNISERANEMAERLWQSNGALSKTTIQREIQLVLDEQSAVLNEKIERLEQKISRACVSLQGGDDIETAAKWLVQTNESNQKEVGKLLHENNQLRQQVKELEHKLLEIESESAVFLSTKRLQELVDAEKQNAELVKLNNDWSRCAVNLASHLHDYKHGCNANKDASDQALLFFEHLKSADNAATTSTEAAPEKKPRTIAEDIAAYKATPKEARNSFHKLVNAIIDLKCPKCGCDVPVKVET
jgi:hypothetical protein